MDGYMGPQNMQGYQNGNYTDDAFDIFANVPNHDLNWDLNSLNNESIAQSASSHLNWQQPTANPSSLDTYGRSFSKSPSVAHAAAQYGYADPRQFSHSPYDPSLVNPSNIPETSAAYVGHNRYSQPLQHATIAPQALQHGQAPFSRATGNPDNQGFNRSSNTAEYARNVPSVPAADQAALFAAIPPSISSGIFSIVDHDGLTARANTRKVNAFVSVGQQEFEYPINKATVPIPTRRKSRNGLRALAKDDPKLLAKLGKKHTRKTHSTAHGKVQNSALATKQWQSPQGIKYDDGSSSEDYSSSDESDDYSGDELAEPSPLPTKRPDDPVEAVKYDTVKATWRSKRFEIDAEDIRTGLREFWEVVRTIRDRWKTDTAAVTEAEKKESFGELPLLKSRVKDQRNMFQATLEAAIQHGHKNILGLFGENKAFLFVINMFLMDRQTAKDYDGPLTRAILEILACCTTLSETTLRTTGLGKTLVRLGKLINAETQRIFKRIDASVADDKVKKGDTVPLLTNMTADVGSDLKHIKVLSRPTSESVAGTKRVAPSGPASDQPFKRPALGPASPIAGASVTNTKAALNVKRAVTNSVTVKSPVPTASNTTKTKPLIPAKSVAGVSSAGVRKQVSAKPKPIPSALEAAMKSINKKAVPSVPPPKPSFSFAETMAGLTQPRQEEPIPKKKEEDKGPPETAEQKAKRLRKEERKKLHVTFKPEPHLVQVRIFHHDVEEELGHDESMIRDVSDRGGEGRMFKQHKEMMDVDDDDEPGQDDLLPYNDLIETDFSTVDAEDRKRNFIPYGGGELEPESPERAVREQYESTTLMAYDSPPCPREPADPYNGEQVTTKAFGTPDPQGIVGVRAARVSGQPIINQHSSTAGPAPDISAILAMIQQPQQQSQQQQSLPPTLASSASAQHPEQFSDLHRILANLPPPPSSQQPPPTAVVPDIASILATLQPQGSGIGMPMVTSSQQSQPPASLAGLIPDAGNLAAILGQLNQGQNGGAIPPTPGTLGQFGFANANVDIQNFPPSQQQLQQVATYENEERRRWRESNEEESGNQNRKWGKSKGKGMGKLYTLPCKYWKVGKCQKGSACTYLHE